MTLEGLRVCREIALAGSFSAAARGLGYSQPAISRQVAAMEAARVPGLAVPTLSEGETWQDLVADRDAFENFDVEAAGRRGMHYAALDQLAVEHLLGARS